MREGWGGMRARLARPDEGVGQRVHQLRAAMINRPRSTSCGALHRRAGEGTRPYMVCANDWASRIHETRRMTKVKNAPRIGYSQRTMNSHERMQRESNLVAIIRKKHSEVAKEYAV